MSSDTSLVFNIVARDRASAVMGSMKDKFATAAAGIGAGVAAAMGIGIAANLDMATANSKLAAQLGVGPAEAAKLSKVSAKVYANAWGESTAQVDDAIRGVYQNIGDVSKVKGGLEGVTTSVLALAQTFDQDLGGVTAAVGQMLKTGLAHDATQALDIITRGFQIGVNKADDFLDTLNEYSTQFRDLGVDGATATGIIAQGLKAGARDGDLVADAMKELNIRVKDMSGAKGLQALGLNAHAMSEAFATGGPRARAALQTITDKLRAVEDPTKRVTLAQQLLGTQSEDLSKALYNINPDAAVQALGKIEGATDSMAKTVGDNPAAALESFKRKATVKLAEITGGFVDFAMKNQQLVVPIAATLGVVAGVILAVQVGTMAWTAATTAWTVATTVATGVQWLWNAAMAANPIMWIIIAVVALVAAVVLLWQRSETFRIIMMLVWAAVLASITFVWNWIKANWPLLLAILTGPIGMAVLLITRNWGRITDGGRAVLRWFQTLPGLLGRALAGLGQILVAPFRWAFNQVAALWNNSIGSFSFSVPSWVPGVGGKGFSFPHMPYLAKGGIVTGSGLAMVGERGPEVVHLPTGAAVTPLTRGGGGGVAVVILDVQGADGDLKKLIRKMVRVDGRGSVQVAFGNG